jgi:hypothetical protein
MARLVYGLDDNECGFDSCQEKEIFLFSIGPGLALEAIQPSGQWMAGDFPLRVKEPGREAYYSPPCRAKSKNVWNCKSEGFKRAA